MLRFNGSTGCSTVVDSKRLKKFKLKRTFYGFAVNIHFYF